MWATLFLSADVQAKVTAAGQAVRADLEAKLQAAEKQKDQIANKLDVATKRIAALDREHDASVAAKERVKQQMHKKISDGATKVRELEEALAAAVKEAQTNKEKVGRWVGE